MFIATTRRATIDDLYREEGKAELIGGRIVRFMASGYLPGRVTGNIYRGLWHYEQISKKGRAFGDGLGYAVPEMASGRESFSPDVSFYDGPPPKKLMRFIEGVPNLAVEVRSEGDYTNAAIIAKAAKRDDYFAAGTQVVWDVDPQAETIAVYKASAPSTPTVYRRGEVAEAEPATPGWRIPVDEVFAP
jgi:Uma2 family endonuclease